MWEENLNMQSNVGKAFSPYKNRLRQIWENRKMMMQQAEDNSMEHLAANSENLSNWSYNVSNPELSKEYNKYGQMSAVAYMVKYAAKRAWQNWTESTPKDIMSRFYTLNPNPEIEKKITEFINSDRDPEEFWIEMGWIPTEIEDNMDFWEKLFLTDWRNIDWEWNWVWDIWNMLSAPWRMLWQGSVDMHMAQWKDNPNSPYANELDAYAIDDYAYRKYWKLTEYMNDEELDRLMLDFQLENAKKWEYRGSDWEKTITVKGKPWDSSLDRWRYDSSSIELLGWAFIEWLNLAFPGATAALSVAGVTPITKQVLWLIAYWGWKLWDLTFMEPHVNEWLESLPDDVQWEMREIVWMTELAAILWGTAKWWRPKIQESWWFKNAIESLESSEIIRSAINTYNKFKQKTSELKEKSYDLAYKAWEKMWERWRWENKSSEQASPKEKSSLRKDFVRDAKRDLEPVWQAIGKGIGYTRENLIQPAIERKTNQWNWERRMPEATDPVEIENIKWKINKKSWEITNADTPETRQRVTNTLWRLSNSDREMFSQQKDLWQLSKTISEKLEKPIMDTEDSILGKDPSLVTRKFVEEKYWWQELIAEDSALWEVSSITWPAARWDVVNKAFDSFFDMARKTEWTKSVETSAMENLYKKYNSWAWLTSLELYQLARYLTRKFRVFQRDWSWTIRDTVSAKYINDLRTAIKNIAKDNVRENLWAEYADYLDILDKFYWDAAVTNDLLSKRFTDALREENTVPSKNYAQEKVSGIPMTVTQIKNMWKDILGWGSKNTPYSVNSELNYKLKLWDEDFDMLWRKLDWPSLEDIIKEVEKLSEKELSALDAEGNPVIKNRQKYLDYNRKNLEYLFKALGYDEQVINEVIEQSLFREWEFSSWKRVDFLWRTRWKKWK